jgi:hypothetical protein
MNIKSITIGATTVPYYQEDDSGILWILRDSVRTLGVVQCSSFTDAYEICEDEFFPEADDMATILRDMETDDIEKVIDSAIFQENYGFRPNGPRLTDKHAHGIYQKDLNGERLDRLRVTITALADHMTQPCEITLDAKSSD